MERCKSAPKLGSIEESPEQEELEERDWLRVLAQRNASAAAAAPTGRPSVTGGPGVTRVASPSRTGSLETVREEERCLPSASRDPSPDAVSPDGLLVSDHDDHHVHDRLTCPCRPQDLAEVKVTLMPDGGSECPDGPPGADASDRPGAAHRAVRLAETRGKRFGSADCVLDGGPASPPAVLPRRARRSLPCRAASVNDYTAELQLQHKRLLVRRQSQPEYVGVARRPASEYAESREPFLYDDEIDFRLRLDSAVELLEADSLCGSPCSSAEHSPNLADKARLSVVAPGAAGEERPGQAYDVAEDNDNVSDESGYADDKDVISSSSSASEPRGVKAGGPSCRINYGMAEEFTLNL